MYIIPIESNEAHLPTRGMASTLRLRISLVEGREIFHFSPKGLTEMFGFWRGFIHTDRPTAHPRDRSSVRQAYQCLLSHFLGTLRAEGAQEKSDCTSML